MKRWIAWTLLAQVLFFVGWGVIEENRKQGAVEFLLETRPVDPRDLLSGHYMTLSYGFIRPPKLGRDDRPGPFLIEFRLHEEVELAGEALASVARRILDAE